jgi:hypothetical protein
MKHLKIAAAVSIIAACAVGPIFSSSATAAFTLLTEKCKEGKASICWDETELGGNLRELKGEEPLEAKSTKAALYESTFNKGAVAVHTECNKTTIKGGVILQTEPLVKGKVTDYEALVFEECKTILPANCKVPATIMTKALVSEAVNQAVVSEGELFKPAAGETWFEVKYSGEECLLKGTQSVTGTLICLWLVTGVDLKGQELICEHGESKLFFAATKEKLTFEVEFLIKLLALEGTDFWDIELS